MKKVPIAVWLVIIFGVVFTVTVLMRGEETGITTKPSPENEPAYEAEQPPYWEAEPGKDKG